MEVQEWLNSDKTIKKSQKGYAHFDYRTDLTRQASYVIDPQLVKAHGFYPFIHYMKKTIKYNGKEKNEKPRDICYAAHIDRCIYQYYCFILNELYNKRVVKDGIDTAAVAYRSNLHMNNIDLAKRAFDFIRSNSPCYVMIGDFTGFFDNLDHKYLKQQWCSLLGQRYLPDDHYQVFKNITKYSKWELPDLLEINGLKDTKSGRKKLNSKAKVLTTDQYNKFKSHIIPNKNGYGIPQGSPISALLANVYMLDIDKTVNDIVKPLNGLYMRYSDDFIIVLPGRSEQSAIDDLSRISRQFNETAGLTLEPNKTQYFLYEDKTIVNCGDKFHVDADCKKRFINFLGFTFDGKAVAIRAKTTAKYYYRMRRKAKTVRKNKGISPKGKIISCKVLYKKYSERGKRNFLSYVRRAEGVFGKEEAVGRDTKRHMQKIRMALNRKG